MAELPKVLVLQPAPVSFAIYEKEFAERFQLLKPWESPIPTEEFLKTHAASVQAMMCSAYTKVTADTLSLLPSLRVIVTSSAGLDSVDLPECRRRGVAVAYAGETFSPDVADTAISLLIDVLRKITASDRFIRAGRWPIDGEYPVATKLGGKRVGIVGLGSIGLEVAKRLVAFGCPISYISRKKKPEVPYPFYNNIVELATNSDILVICCALTGQTFHLINKQVLLALGKKGVVINIARGAVVDEKELVKCLVKGDIAGAGLDVFEIEPNVPKELIELDNVVLTPHQAVYTHESFFDLFNLMSGNLEAFFSNKPLLSPFLDE